MRVTAPPPKADTIEPEPIPLEIVYEDEHLMAINKQADLMVHPARGRWHGTLVNALVYYAKQWSTVRGPHRPGILHRLDRNTTGIMLVAKSDEAHWRIGRQFENRTIQKTYMALAHGVPELLADQINASIGQDPTQPRATGRPQDRRRRQDGQHAVRGARKVRAAKGVADRWTLDPRRVTPTIKAAASRRWATR